MFVWNIKTVEVCEWKAQVCNISWSRQSKIETFILFIRLLNLRYSAFSIGCFVLYISDLLSSSTTEPPKQIPENPQKLRKRIRPNKKYSRKDCYNYKCVLCREVCTSKQRYLNHVETHRFQPTPFVCVFCKQEFKSFKDICAHKVEHESLEKQWICHVCGNASRTIYSLRLHLLIHKDEKPFKCSHCDKAFRMKQHLVSHERVHSNERPFKCHTCGMSFKFQQALRNHRRIMHEAATLKACPHGCGRIFSSQGGLKQHIKREHLKELDYHCDFCAAKFSSSSHFKRHLRNVHKYTGDVTGYIQSKGKFSQWHQTIVQL